eukprot:3285107-Pyramimonas_sp.AAC.1
MRFVGHDCTSIWMTVVRCNYCQHVPCEVMLSYLVMLPSTLLLYYPWTTDRVQVSRLKSVHKPTIYCEVAEVIPRSVALVQFEPLPSNKKVLTLHLHPAQPSLHPPTVLQLPPHEPIVWLLELPCRSNGGHAWRACGLEVGQLVAVSSASVS